MIYQNAVKITEGDKVTFLISRNVHDFRMYKFADGRHEYFVDGGLEYLRRGGDAPEDCKIEDYSLNSEDSEEDIIMRTLWGTRGKSGKEPLQYKLMVTLELDHIKALWRDFGARLGKAQLIAVKARLRLSDKEVEQDRIDRKIGQYLRWEDGGDIAKLLPNLKKI